MSTSRLAAGSAWALGAASYVGAEPVAGLSGLPLRRDAADDASVAGAWLFLGLLVAAGAAAVWFRRARNTNITTRSRLQRTESLVLTAHASLHVVRWGEEELLLGCTQASVDVVSRRAAESKSDGDPS